LSRIIIAAQNALGAGARVIGHALLPELCRQLSAERVRVLLPDTPEYRALDVADAEPVYFPIQRAGVGNDLARLWQLYARLPHEISALRADTCFTLADLGPVKLPCRHVIFLHQPLLVYAEHELGGRGGWSPPKRRFMLDHFRRSARRADCVVVQTHVMAERVEKHHGVSSDKIAVLPLPAPWTAEAAHAPQSMATSPAQCKLLFLAQYYPHKNHSILPAVCHHLRSRGLGERVCFFLTLNDETCRERARRLEMECSGMVINLGTLPRAAVYPSLRQASALFLPTLVESYGLPYLEAMRSNTPILTSNRDFAHGMCGGLAHYFEPLDPCSIADAIERFVRSKAPRLDSKAVAERFKSLPSDWSMVAASFAQRLR
jgi:glycosyltransferase involved in cell wall biosynthesis